MSHPARGFHGWLRTYNFWPIVTLKRVRQYACKKDGGGSYLKQEALRQAWDRFAAAKSAERRMREAKSLNDAESAWIDFLMSAHTVYSKLKIGVRGTSNEGWWSQKVQERASDPLLSYLHHARNADEHGVDFRPAKQPGRLLIGRGGQAIRLDGTLGPGGMLRVTSLDGSTPHVEITQPQLELVPVTDRGITYSIPTHHLGKAIEHATPVECATLAIVYLQALLQDAGSRKVQ